MVIYGNRVYTFHAVNMFTSRQGEPGYLDTVKDQRHVFCNLFVFRGNQKLETRPLFSYTKLNHTPKRLIFAVSKSTCKNGLTCCWPCTNTTVWKMMSVRLFRPCIQNLHLLYLPQRQCSGMVSCQTFHFKNLCHRYYLYH